MLCSRSRESDSDTPRLESQISCTSSMITYLTPSNFFLKTGVESTSASDSGVVMNMCGGLLACF